MKHGSQHKVDGLLSRAQATLDGIAREGSQEPDVDAQVAMADITLAIALMQYDQTYQPKPRTFLEPA